MFTTPVISEKEEGSDYDGKGGQGEKKRGGGKKVVWASSLHLQQQNEIGIVCCVKSE